MGGVRHLFGEGSTLLRSATEHSGKGGVPDRFQGIVVRVAFLES